MHRKALEVYKALGRKEGMATAYAHLGLVYQTDADLAQAEVMHKRALELFEVLGDREGMAATCGNLGLVYQTRGDLAQAAAIYKKSLVLFQQLGGSSQVQQVQALLDHLVVARATSGTG